MKAAVFYGREDIRVEEVPDPIPLEDEVLLRVRYCGICGSDLSAWKYGMYASGVVLGHEFSAEVEATGAGVTEWSEGDRVVANSIIPCRKCAFCNEGNHSLCNDMRMPGISVNGGLAELVALPADTLLRIPPSVTWRDAALAEPLAVVLHGVRKIHLNPADIVLVLGAGPIGLLAGQVARLSGASFVAVSEVNPLRLHLAETLGFYPINPRETNVSVEVEREAGSLPDCVVECTGQAQAAAETFSLVKKGGTVLVLGVTEEIVEADFMTALLNELTYVFAYCGYTELPQAVNLIARGAVDTETLITKEIPLEEVVDGFRELTSPSSRNVKILVRIGGD